MSYLPRDFIETAEGLVFAVVDATLEDHKVMAFLRYAAQDQAYLKLNTEAANQLLQQRFPHYLHRSRRLDTQLHAVSTEQIVHHHQPRARLRSLMMKASTSTDPIEAKLLLLVRMLVEYGADLALLGVTGSLLIGQQNDRSDLDLVVYERDQFFAVQAAVVELIAQGLLQELDTASWQDAYDRRGCALDFDDYVRHERRKGNKGLIAGTKFDLALVQDDFQADTAVWLKAGRAKLRARVIDDRYRFDQPARYRLDHPEIGEALSFTHTYTGQALRGETVEISGLVELSENGEKRLIVGSSRESPGEYIRVLWEP